MSFSSTSSQVADGGLKITVIVTDVRLSRWENVPENDRRQKDWKLKDIIIYRSSHSRSYKNLMEQIKVKYGNSAYEIANPDFTRITSKNAGQLLSNGNSYVLVDKGQRAFPLNYEHDFSCVPHIRAVTNQEGKFYGTDEHNAAAFALAELVDNSLAATVRNPVGERNIEIHFYDGGATHSSSIHVLDNGCGMDSETLKLGLKFKAPKEGRKSQLSDPSTVPAEDATNSIDENEDAHPIYLNSNISKFGAGLKTSAFYLGEEVRIITKIAGTENVREVRLSSAEMEAKERAENKNPWMEKQVTRKVGVPRDVNASQTVKNLIIEREPCSPSFTHVVIENIRHIGGESSVYNLLRRNDIIGIGEKYPSIEKQLSHIYHYYLRGRDGGFENNAKINLSIHRHDASGKEKSSINLCNLVEGAVQQDLEFKFAQTAAPHPYRFTAEVSSFNKTTNAVALKVGGIIRYHPFLYDKETKPGGILTSKQQDEGNHLEVTEIDEGSGSAQKPNEDEVRKSREFFHIWWNGRLIPHTKLESFYWCSPGSRMKSTDKLYKPYGRISGSLFFDSAASKITDNKLNLTATDELYALFSEKAIGIQATYKRVEESLGGDEKICLKSKRMPGAPKKNFQDWLSGCHKYDKQVIYKGPMTLHKPLSQGLYYPYKTAIWDNRTFRVGDAVKLINTRTDNTSNVLGIIQYFYVPAALCQQYLSANPSSSASGSPSESNLSLPDRVDAPLSKFVMELQPASYYGEDRTREKEMRLIDRTGLGLNPKEMILQQINELKEMKLGIQNWGIGGAELKNGDEVPLDEVLVKLVVFDVLNNEGNSLSGYLPHYETKTSRKSIHMIARVYLLHEDNSRVLYYTSNICNHDFQPKGYYFKSLDLKQMPIDKLGNFVITFRTYIDLDKSDSVNPNTLPRSTRSRRSNPASPAPTKNSNRSESVRENLQNLMPIDPEYGLEWNMEVDSIGRKILKEGETKIRMPFHEIFFSVVPGSPHSLSIDEFGEEGTLNRIGEPFKIVLSFKDSCGNVTVPKNWDSVLSSQLIIAALPSKKFPNLALKFAFKKVYQANGSLVIDDVVGTGHLLGNEWKECKVEVRVELEKKTYKTSQPVRFHYGRAHTLEVEEDSITFENGSKPGITCFVLDSSKNIIPYIEDTKKPVLLAYAVYKEGNDEPLFTGNVLAATTHVPQLMDNGIDLPELKTGQCPSVNLRCQLTYREIQSEPIPISVIPSTRPETVRVYLRNDDNLVEVSRKSEMVRKIKEKLSLSFRLFDGQGKQVVFNGNIHQVFVNWADPEDSPVSKEDGNEALPEFAIPSKVKRKKKLITTLKISDFEGSVTHKFYLTSTPLKISALRARFLSPSADEDDKIPRGEEVKIPICETLPDLVVNLLDAYDNVITDVQQEDTSRLEISADPFDLVEYETSVGNSCQTRPTGECTFIIEKLRLDNPALGQLSIAISYETFQDVLSINLIPGLPVGLAFEMNGELLHRANSFYTLPNESDIPIRVVLLDTYQNPTLSREDSMISLSFGPEKEWQNNGSPSSQILLKKGEGSAEFGILNVKAPKKTGDHFKSCVVKGSSCAGRCFGKTQFVRVDCNTLRSSTVKFHITARPERPFDLLVEILDRGSFSYAAGSSFHNLTVTLEAEDGNKCVSAQKEHLKLDLTNIEDLNQNDRTKLTLDADNVQEGVYTFGQVPTRSGYYNATFVYNNPVLASCVSHAFPDKLHIRAGEVFSLEPEHKYQNLSVSNDRGHPESLVILENLKLMLRDKYGNICTPDNDNHLNGLITIATSLNNKKIDLLHSPVLSTIFHLQNGAAEFPRLIVQQNLNLDNFTKPTIHFTATMEKTAKKITYDLEFIFFNSVRVQTEIRRLETSAAELEQLRKSNQAEQDNIKKERDKLAVDYVNKEKMEIQEREAIARHLGTSRTLENLKTVQDISNREKLIATNKRRFVNEDTVKGNVQRGHWSEEPHVLGTVGLLAKVKYSEGPAIQRVLSWHLQGNLNVIVVEEENKGLELRNRFPRQKFMLLDIIRGGNSNWNERSSALQGPGNPVYARFLLVMTTGEEKRHLFQKVFDTILGNVIVVDTLPDATRFMKDFNRTQKYSCPTILTRNGQRLSSSGIIGGDSGSAPDLDRLPFKLGLAPNPEIANIQKELDILPLLKRDIEIKESAFQRLQQFDNETKEQLQTLCKSIRDATEEHGKILAKLQEMKNNHLSPNGSNSSRSRPSSTPERLAKRPRFQ